MFKLGLQIYSVRDAYAADVIGSFKRAKEIGYEGVELFGSLATHKPEFLRDCLDECGLEICGFHTGWQEFETEEKIKNVISYMKTLGCDYVIVPWMPEKTVEQWREQICAFNKLCARFREEGLRFGFHAHKGEMSKISNGMCAWEIIGDKTPADFIMQIDIGNAASGGQDPIALYKKYAGKGVTVHYKAYSNDKGTDCSIGEDDMDWNEIVNISKSVPECAWAIVEKDAQDNFVSVEKSFKALKKLV